MTERADTDWIDISVTFSDNMVSWPKDPFPPSVKRIMDVNEGDKVTMSELHIISHTGTHLDAPLHFVPGGDTIDHMPLDTAVGPARVIEIKDPESIKPAELEQYDIQPGERILFKTQNSEKLFQKKEFTKDYVYITFEAAEYLAKKGIRLVAIDYITLCKYESEDDWDDVKEYLAKSDMHRTHRMFLENGIYILEFVKLTGVKPGTYELICLPIKLDQGDAGLARAILRPL